ncbi:MAG: hypothetical protein M0009_05265 [Deltaproteobacteria bacterium]|nr:hypothetical protein [Deltaproteobacteria bacterium]
MSTTEIVLILFLIPLTAFNLYHLTVGKKKKRAAAQQYRQIFSELAQKTSAEMEKRKLQFDEQQFFLNDAGEGIQLSFDKESRQMALTLKDAFHVLSLNDVQPCSVRHDEENGKYSNIRVEVRTAEQVIPIALGTKAWRPKSILGKMIIENATDFCNQINAHRSPAAPETAKGTAPREA